MNPKEIEAQWLEELTVQWLRQLNAPGNWWVVHLLIHHGDYRHLEAVLGASPKGVLWERCTFLEHFLRYLTNSVEQGLVSAAAAQSALDSAMQHSVALRRRARSDKSRRRVDNIIQEVESMKKRQANKGMQRIANKHGSR